VHAPTEDKNDDTKNSFYKELECVFDRFQKCHMKILLGDFTTNVWREDIFEPTVRNESVHEINNINGVRLVNVATSKNLIVKCMMFPHFSIHKYTWTSPDGEKHNQIDHVLTDKRWHSNTVDVRCFKGADCDTEHYFAVVKVRKCQ
jgi:hypothetical protein